MHKAKNPNLALLEAAVEQLGDVADDMVFLGGCATGLLITDLAAPPVRGTRDVDAIVQVATRSEYYLLSDRLRDKGFSEDTSDGAPLCRWISKSVILDVMPTNPAILGFANAWYEKAMETSTEISLESGSKIRMVSAPYFLITKLEAFEGRGKGDYLLSRDIEDFIAVIDGRPEALNEIQRSDSDLKAALSDKCKHLMGDGRFIEAAPGHMPSDETSQARASRALEIISNIADMQ